MKWFKNLKSDFMISKEYTAEFNEENRLYNNVAVSIISVLAIILMTISILIGCISYWNGASGVDEIWLILPYNIACIVVSIISFIILTYLRRQKKSSSWISDMVALVNISLIMLFILGSSHVEIGITGIKNINVIIILMFALGFFIRFRLQTTIILEISYTIITIILLIFEKSSISNFYPSLINLGVSCVIASVAAYLYWRSRMQSFIGTKNLETLAASDQLTRLYNRRSFDIYIEKEWNRALAENLSLTIFMVDVDNFKKYNDNYGHQEGDKCLATVADVLSKSVRKNDFVARYGGEEFVILLTKTSLKISEKIAEKMLDEMHKCNILHEENINSRVTFSIGCMICNPKKTYLTLEEFIDRADKALYMAKENGRNRLVVHPDSLKD